MSESKNEDDDGSVISTTTDKFGFFGGFQYDPEPQQLLSPVAIMRRERKWLEMLQNWKKYKEKDTAKIRKRCYKGIPTSVRPRAYLYMCAGKVYLDLYKGLYEEFIHREGDAKCVDDIRKDLHRQFPYHEMFADPNGNGQKDLFNVLKAYTIYNPADGYCQAQAPIAAFLLMYMPAEEAFWCLNRICDKYLDGYYCKRMETLLVDGDILFALMKRLLPNIYKLLKKQNVEPILYMTEWFLCVYTRTLPWTTLLRVWDIFLWEGVAVLFKVALIILKTCLRGKSYGDLKKQYPTMYETLEALRNPPRELLTEEIVIQQVKKITIASTELEYLSKRLSLKRREKKAAQKSKSDS